MHIGKSVKYLADGMFVESFAVVRSASVVLCFGDAFLSGITSDELYVSLVGSGSRILSSSLSWRSLKELFVSALAIKNITREHN